MNEGKDRRSHQRKKLSENTVMVYYRGRRIHRCEASDVSRKGVFLRTTSFPVAQGAKLRLLFVFRSGNILQTYRKAAVVVRVSREGVGLSFIGRPIRAQGKDSSLHKR